MNNDHLKQHGIRGSSGQALFAATLSFFIGLGAVALFAPAAKSLKECMHLSGTTLGLLVAMPQLSGSLLRIPVGALADKAGGKRPIIALLLLSIVGIGGLAWLLRVCYPYQMGGKYLLVLFLGVLSGCGGATFSAGIPQTAYWHPKERQGVALGIFAGLGNTSPGLFTLVLPFAFAGLGLSGTYWVWFALLAAGTLVYWLTAQDAPYYQLVGQGVGKDEATHAAKGMGEELFPTGRAVDALKISAKIGRTWALVALYVTSFGGFLALTTWFPIYWNGFHGVSPRTAGILTAVGFSLLASVVRAVSGKACDRHGGETVAIFSFALVLAGSLILIAARGFAPALAGELLAGAGMGLANAAVFKLVPKYVPEAVGGASGWIGGLGAFGGFAVPPLLGWAIDAFGTAGYAYGFGVYIVLAAVSILISYTLKKRFGGEA